MNVRLRAHAQPSPSAGRAGGVEGRAANDGRMPDRRPAGGGCHGARGCLGRMSILAAALLGIVLVASWTGRPRHTLEDVRTTCLPSRATALAASESLILVGLKPRPHRRGDVGALWVFEQGPSGRLARRGELRFEREISRIATDGRHAYVVAGGLHVVDLREPDRPGAVAFLDGSMPFERLDGSVVHHDLSAQHGAALTLHEDHALVQVRSHGLGIVDVAEPERAALLSWHTIPHGDGASGVAASDQLAYVMERGLRVLDIEDPRAPREVGLVEVPGEARVARSMAVDDSGRALYVVANGGLHAFDLTEPRRPRYEGKAEPAKIWAAGLGTLLAPSSYRDVLSFEGGLIGLTWDSPWRCWMCDPVPGPAVLLLREQGGPPRRVGPAWPLGRVDHAAMSGPRLVLARSSTDAEAACSSEIVTATLTVDGA